MIKILYLGNDLSATSKYHSAYATLKQNLIAEDYQVVTASSKKNQVLRLLDMVFKTFLHSNKVAYVLVDVFSTKAFYYAFITSQIARLYGTKYIPILHGGNLPNRLNKSPKLCHMLFGNAYSMVAPSKFLQTSFKEKGYDTLLIPNTIDIATMVFKPREVLAPRILYARAFAEIYNPVLAVEVLKELHKDYPKATLCMVGPDRDGTLKKVQKKIEIYGLEEHVKITGVLPKAAWHRLSEQYHIFINTTNVDNTPVSLIEAMALGLPIVSTNVGGISYLIEHQTNGLLVAPNDVLEMTNGIKYLLKNPKKAYHLSKTAREKVMQMDWKAVKHQWKNVLK